MRRKTEIEMQRQRISLRLRGEASVLRAEYLNQVLPAALEEFDRRLQGGEAVEVTPVNITRLIEQAVSEVQG